MLQAIEWQLACGFDVLVHGEAERGDRIEYFAEGLWGFAISAQRWTLAPVVTGHMAAKLRPLRFVGARTTLMA